MKKIIFLSILIVNNYISQTNQYKENRGCLNQSMVFIRNDRIDYSIVMMTCDTCVPIKSNGCRVVVNLTDKDIEIAEKLSASCWLLLLENDKTDWAANIVLYSLYNKEALLLSRNEIVDWKRFFKKEEIEYWEKFLYRKGNFIDK